VRVVGRRHLHLTATGLGTDDHRTDRHRTDDQRTDGYLGADGHDDDVRIRRPTGPSAAERAGGPHC
jgi:hypothetical protein